MNLTSVLVMEHFSLPFLLTSLILGMVILILLEKRKGLNKEERVQKTTLRNTTAISPATQVDVKASIKDSKDTAVPETAKEENCSTEQPAENSTKEYVLHEPVAASSSSCSSSGSEEEASRPRRVSRRPKKKHACKGSAILCATKRKVTAVTIVTDSEEEEVKVCM